MYTVTIKESLGAKEQMERIFPRLKKDFPNMKYQTARDAIIGMAKIESGAYPNSKGNFKTKKEAQKLTDSIWKIFVYHGGIDKANGIDSRCACKNDIILATA